MNCLHATASLLVKILTLALLGFVFVVVAGPCIALVAGVLSLLAAMLAVILPFALVGFLVWAVVEGVAYGGWTACASLRRCAGGFSRTIVTPASRLALFLGRGSWRACRRICPKGQRGLELVGEAVYRSCEAGSIVGQHAYPLGHTAWRGCRKNARSCRSFLYRAAGHSYQLGSDATRRAYPVGEAAWNRCCSRAQALGATLFELACGAAVGALLGALSAPKSSEIEFMLPVGALVGASFGLLLGISRHLPREQPQLPEGIG